MENWKGRKKEIVCNGKMDIFLFYNYFFFVSNVYSSLIYNYPSLTIYTLGRTQKERAKL